MDVHVRRAISDALRLRQVDVLTAQADGATRLPDAELLDRAAALGRVLFTHDTDLLAEASRRQRSGVPFAGLIFAHQLRIHIGQCIADLELLARATDPEDWRNHVEYLPLK
jgi:predicted nuclease of predicted toxin-antitoxin system